MMLLLCVFNATSPTEIYTLSLHDALPIYRRHGLRGARQRRCPLGDQALLHRVVRGSQEKEGRRACGLPPPASPSCGGGDRKSTRLNSSHANISYAVFCLKKKTKTTTTKTK